MKLICIECKNEIDTSPYPNLSKNQTLECNHCGISLLVSDVKDSGEVEVEIADEGK
ncbi:MAG: hypothetical protein Q8P86_01445 [bacterium]|nr:hypothetical protein [bacterium]